jgi:CRISPR/Cas system CSM-associated protein Csm5 (group 7 of RAMP superfamily)
MKEVYVSEKEKFIDYLAKKHKKSYEDILVKDLSVKDLKLWQSIEDLNNVKLCINLGK